METHTVEFYGAVGELFDAEPFEEQEHYIVPALALRVGEHLKWNVGAAFGLTRAADDLVLKSILEWEP